MAEHKGIVSALAAVQGKLPTVAKGQTARVTSRRTGQTHTYTYATLADVAEAVYPLLSGEGLAFVCAPSFRGERYVLAARLEHSSGEARSALFPLPTDVDPQSLGSALTYGRRYLLGCLTGVVTDDDDDGAKATETHQKRAARKAPEPLSGDEAQSLYSEFAEAIAAAESKADLAVVAKRIAESRLAGEPREQLRLIYDARVEQVAA